MNRYLFPILTVLCLIGMVIFAIKHKNSKAMIAGAVVCGVLSLVGIGLSFHYWSSIGETPVEQAGASCKILSVDTTTKREREILLMTAVEHDCLKIVQDILNTSNPDEFKRLMTLTDANRNTPFHLIQSREMAHLLLDRVEGLKMSDSEVIAMVKQRNNSDLLPSDMTRKDAGASHLLKMAFRRREVKQT